MTEEQIQLMIQIIDNLEVYVSDDRWVEMEEDMVGENYTDFAADVENLKADLEKL